MRGPTGSLRAALLGLALERPGHGYDLAARLIDRLGPTWPVAPKDVYRLLRELHGAGLLSLRSESRSGKQLDVYHPTAATASALTLWIETLGPKEPARDAIRAKIAVSRESDAQSLRAALGEYERQCLKLLRDVPPATHARGWAGLAIDCARDAADAQLRGEVEWARRTRKRIQEHLEARR